MEFPIRSIGLFDFILYVPVNNFSVMSDKSSWIEARINVYCSRIQHSEAGEARTMNPSVLRKTLYHCAPSQSIIGKDRPVEFGTISVGPSKLGIFKLIHNHGYKKLFVALIVVKMCIKMASVTLPLLFGFS